MKLRSLHNFKDFIPNLVESLEALGDENPFFDRFINEDSIFSNTYIVGGYIRSVINKEKPRDLDLIVNLTKEALGEQIARHFSNYKQNRLGGYKIFLKNLTVDTWSMDDNWAFRTGLVIPGEESKLVESISKGTFFNYDSLVLHLETNKHSFKNYNRCAKLRELDIIQRNSTYKKLNPTREANVLRALYLKEKYELKFSGQLLEYIAEYITYSQQTFGSPYVKLKNTLNRYDKYQTVLGGKKIEELLDSEGLLGKGIIEKRDSYRQGLFAI